MPNATTRIRCALAGVTAYGNVWAAAADGKVVTFGEDLAQVEDRAAAKAGEREVPVMFIDTWKHLHGEAFING